jgi:hypothetical protein
MSNYNTNSTDLKSLIGTEIPSEYISQERDRELLDVSCEVSDPLTCYFCSKPIEPDQSINLHHPIYKSDGGTQVEPAHERCHVEYHSSQGDFRNWGKLSSLTRAWAFNLKNVKDNPAYEFDRQYYLALYSH